MGAFAYLLCLTGLVCLAQGQSNHYRSLGMPPAPTSPPSTPAGQPCRLTSECESGLTCRRHFCRRILNKGERCGTRDTWCSSESKLMCMWRRCVDKVRPNGLCRSHRFCWAGYICKRKSRTERRCVEGPKLGERCGGRSGRCPFPYRCTGSRYEAGICTRGRHLGEQCDLKEKCIMGLQCDNGYCIARMRRRRVRKKRRVKTVGEGRRCSLSRKCQTGLQCVMRRCRPASY